MPASRLPAALAYAQGPRFLGDVFTPYGSARWARVSDVSFYGLGNDSSGNQRIGYDVDPTVLAAGVNARAHRTLNVSAGYESIGFQTELVHSDQDPAALALLSHGTRLRFNVTDVNAVFDARTSPG